MPRQCRFDLTQLDAEAAYLDLMVDASQELKLAVGPPPGEIARAVETGTRLGGERVGTKCSTVRSGLFK